MLYGRVTDGDVKLLMTLCSMVALLIILICFSFSHLLAHTYAAISDNSYEVLTALPYYLLRSSDYLLIS